MYSILSWLRAISIHPVCCDDDQDGGIEVHWSSAISTLSHIHHNMMTTLIQEKSEAGSNAFLHVDYSDGIMPGLARYKNCDLSSNIDEPCPKSLYEYYTSLEGQCLAVELISLILVCLIFHCLASIIYLTGQSLCISLTTPLSLIIKLFIWSWMLSWWITWRTIILISSIHPWRMKWTWNVCMKERPSIVPRDMLVIISFIFKLMIGLCLLRFVNVDQPYSSFHSLANKLSNWHQGIIATLDMQVAFLSSRFGWEHLMLEDVLSWCRNSSHPMRLQIDECLNIEC